MGKVILRLIALAGACALPLILTGQSTMKAPQAIVFTGQIAPSSNGARLQSLGPPSINNSGDVAFRGGLTESTVYYGKFEGKLSPSGIFLASKGSILRITGSGDPVPKRSETFSDVGDPALNDSGQIAFMARIGGGYENAGIFLRTGTDLIPIAITGDPAPGTGGTFLTFSQALVNNAGTVAFGARFNGPQAGTGIFVYLNGKLKPAVLHSQPAPTHPPGVFERFHGLAINASDQLVFSATVNMDNRTVEKNGVFILLGSGITLAAIEGGSAGNRPQLFGALTQPAINDAGDIAFLEAVRQRGGFGSRNVPNGVFAIARQNVVAVAGAGKASNAVASAGKPSSPDGPIFAQSFQRPAIVRNNDGTDAVFFIARTEAPRGSNGLWKYSHSALTRIAQEGEPTTAGGSYSFISGLAVSSSGYCAFVSGIKGSAASAGIFVNKIGL